MEITKEEFLLACNQKIQQDNDLADEEARARAEAEARARAEARANAEWDSWYSSLPSNCKQGFDFNGFSYRVNPNTRTTTKQSIGGGLGDFRLRGADTSVNFSSLEINAELGI